MNLGNLAYEKLEALSQFTDSGEGITRLFLTKEHREASNYLREIMEKAGLEVEMDNIGNLIGTYRTSKNTDKTLVLGSHQDTVKNGGKYDGALGIILPIVALEKCIKDGIELDYNVKIVSFGDEEGVRFATTYLGSKALAGTFTEDLLERISEEGTSLRDELINFGLNPEAIGECRLKENVTAYLEIHIEQGPVLEHEDLAIGIVNAIQGSHRYQIDIEGIAGHAGTVPMKYRSDAGIGSAEVMVEFTNYIEKLDGIVATFGIVELSPGSINVIPGKSRFTLDIRSLDNNLIASSVEKFKEIVSKVAERRKLRFKVENTNIAPSCECSSRIINMLEKSVEDIGYKPFTFPSGAGHDAQEMKNLTDMGMLFVRCKDGISHNPLESVKSEDLEIASEVLVEFLKNYN